MIVPKYWAEARLQEHKDAQQQITVRRWGWSSESQAQAQSHADSRAQEALKKILAGEDLLRREPKVPYNGADGVPIREEIIEEHDTSLVTRNSYGARCLNSPDVVFIDVDFDQGLSLRSYLLWLVPVQLFLMVSVWWLNGGPPSFLGAFVLGFILTLSLVYVGQRCRIWLQGGKDKLLRQRIHSFLGRYPQSSFRLYRTPAGMRLMATHQLFDPHDAWVAECFKALGADPVYVRLCHHQRCFRARVSAKPWRIGITEHMRPRPGVWPVAPERLPQRQAWVAHYEAAAEKFAACQFIETLGTGTVHFEVKPVQELHDALCQALKPLPIA